MDSSVSKNDGRNMEKLILSGERRLRVSDVVNVAVHHQEVGLSESAWERVRYGRRVVERIVGERVPAYGITTGVGSQKDYAVSPEELKDYNRRLLIAHGTRVPGPVIEKEEARAAILIMLNLFASGSSGIRPVLLQSIIQRLKDDRIYPVDDGGSVGASDLVPLAQLGLSFVDKHTELNAKEALSLMNSNAVSLGRGALQLFELKRLFYAFDISAAVSLEGFRSNLGSISEPVNRGHERIGQKRAARRLRILLAESGLREVKKARFLQDPLSFRCISQVHGAGRIAFDWALNIWETELNAVTDNPLIDLTTDCVVSHGNMDTSLITLATDTVCEILAKIADLSGERMNKLQSSPFSGLPVGLTTDEQNALGGVQFLNFSHIAASLITSLKIWAHPHLTHSVGQLCDGVEDTAGWALHSVSDLKRCVENGWKIATLEMMIGAWAIHRRELPLEELGQGIRPVVSSLIPLLPIGREGVEGQFDMEPVLELIKNGTLMKDVQDAAGDIPPPEVECPDW